MCLLAPSHIRRLFLQTRGDISRCFVVSKPAVFHREVRASRPVTSPERNHSVVMGEIENSTQTNVKMQLFFFLQTLTFILLMVHPWLQTSLISVMPCYFAAVCFPSEWECFGFFLFRKKKKKWKEKKKETTDRQTNGKKPPDLQKSSLIGWRGHWSYLA